jgi:integrase
MYDFFEYLTSREDAVDQRHLPAPGLFLESDFPSPHRRGVKHFPRWLEKLLHQHILNLPEENRPYVARTNRRGRNKRNPHELDSLRFKVIMLLLYHVGARIKDACTLEADCLIEKYGAPWLKIFSNKTKRIYDIPITPELARALSQYMSKTSGERRKHPTLHKDANFLFWTDLDRDFPHFLRSMAAKVRDFNRLVLEVAKESGHPVQDVAELNLTSHKYRHTVAIRLVRLGADPMLVAEFLGHTDLTMAQAYIQESQQEIDELMEELWDDDLLDLTEDIVDNFNFSRDDLYGTSGVISKVECGHCAHLGDKPPCGEEAYGCWLCEKLEPDHEDPDYPGRLKEMLVDHQVLRDRNIHLGHMGAAKVEQEVIKRIQAFMGMLPAEGSA